jgi:hypothetical protein
VREYWIVDARARTLTVFVAERGRFDAARIVEATETFASTVLEGLVVRPDAFL